MVAPAVPRNETAITARWSSFLAEVPSMTWTKFETATTRVIIPRNVNKGAVIDPMANRSQPEGRFSRCLPGNLFIVWANEEWHRVAVVEMRKQINDATSNATATRRSSTWLWVSDAEGRKVKPRKVAPSRNPLMVSKGLSSVVYLPSSNNFPSLLGCTKKEINVSAGFVNSRVGYACSIIG